MMTDETHPKHCIIRHIIIDRLLVAPLLGTFLSGDFSQLCSMLCTERYAGPYHIWNPPFFFSPLSTRGIILLSCAYLDTYAFFYKFYLYFKEARFPPYGPHTYHRYRQILGTQYICEVLKQLISTAVCLQMELMS